MCTHVFFCWEDFSTGQDSSSKVYNIIRLHKWRVHSGLKFKNLVLQFWYKKSCIILKEIFAVTLYTIAPHLASHFCNLAGRWINDFIILVLYIIWIWTIFQNVCPIFGVRVPATKIEQQIWRIIASTAVYRSASLNLSAKLHSAVLFTRRRFLEKSWLKSSTSDNSFTLFPHWTFDLKMDLHM